MAYFDYNSTTPLSDSAKSVWLDASVRYWNNPSSLYRDSLKVKVLLDEARASIANKINVLPEEIIFTSGATEGNNAIFDYIKSKSNQTSNVLISSVEHASVFQPATLGLGKKCLLVPVNSTGIIDLEWLEKTLNESEVSLVSVMAISSETGVIQPWKEVAEICNKKGILYHCDAVAWIGKMPWDDFSKCDFVTVSAHKFGGPKGIGFMKVSTQCTDFKFLKGGQQEFAKRAGTVNYPSIASMLSALTEQSFDLNPQSLKNKLEFESLLKDYIPGTIIVGEEVPRLWNTSMILLPKYDNIDWIRLLDLEGFQVAAGSACSNKSNIPSRVLDQIGIDPKRARSAIRVSGWYYSSEVWMQLAEAFKKVWEKLNASYAQVIDID